LLAIAGIVQPSVLGDFQMSKLVTFAVFAAVLTLFTIPCVAQQAHCPDGFQFESMNQDTLHYCTRIPSLHEQADRAEAFLQHGLKSYDFECAMMQKGKSNLTDKQRLQWLGVEIMTMSLDALEFVDPSSPFLGTADQKRLSAAIAKMDQSIHECTNKIKGP
jgi:hypothetical protein